MKIDILVVSFHAKKELAQCLSSIALHSAPGYRLTVHDNTAINYSLTWVWNRFVDRSKRELIALINSDVIVGPGWDSEAVAFLQQDPQVASVSPLSNYPPHHPLAVIPGPTGQSVDEIVKATEERKKNPLRFHKGNHYTLVAGHCMIVRKAAHAKVGGFNEAYPFANNDYDFNQRLLKAGMALGVCLHALSLHWWNASTNDAKKKGVSPHFVTGSPGTTFDTI